VPEQSGLEEIFEEISPIEDFSGTMSLSFRDHRFEPPKYSSDECKDKDMTYSAPMFVTAEFINNTTGEIKSQTVFMGDFPLMSAKGTFIINGTERVVVSQLVRSPRPATRTSTPARSSRAAVPGSSSRSTSGTASASASTASASRASPCC
jgi:DNA-directed RNA polymerase subunit beta